MTQLAFNCRCGTVQGHVEFPSPASGNHCYCHCPDCRAAALHFGSPDPVATGVHIWQTRLDRVHFTSGLDRVARFQLGPKGIYRWYARCCDTQLTSSFHNPRLPIGGFLADRLESTETLGPVVGHFFIAKPGGGYRHRGLLKLGPRFLRMVLSANLTGRWRESPFFDADGQPVGPSRILTREERAALYQA